MKPAKPRITTFQWHSRFMAIGWETMERAFDISEYGDAGILKWPPHPSGLSVMGAISANKIKGFMLRVDAETGLTEVVLKVTYHSGEECLGLTNQIEEAKRWVADANEFVQKARRRRELRKD